MEFKELYKILYDDFGVSKFSDVAKEMGVSPQVVNNWKKNNQVPYKYVLELREKINEKDTRSKNNKKTYIIEKEVKKATEIKGITINDLIKFVIKPILSEFTKISLFVIIIAVIIFIRLQYFIDPIYQSKSKVIALNSDETKGGAQNLASKFGINLAVQSESDILGQIVPDILKTRILAKSILKENFSTITYGDSMSLLDIYKIKLNNSDINFVTEFAINDVINNILIVKNSNFSPFIELITNAIEPQFAFSLNERVIEKLEKVLNEFKSIRNEDKMEFIKARFNEVDQEVKKEEEKLKVFREKNRMIAQSPALLLEQDRILRDLDVKTQILTTLKQEYELLQIEKVGNENNIMIIESPTTPLNRHSPKITETLIITIIISTIFASALAILTNIYDPKVTIEKIKKLL